MGKVSKKLEVYRQSGQPVSGDAQALYKTEWQAFYDKAAARAGLNMLSLQRFLRYGERQLTLKHNVKVEVDIPKSAKAWMALLATYEDTPLMMAKTTDGKKLVLIIMDVFQS